MAAADEDSSATPQLELAGRAAPNMGETWSAALLPDASGCAFGNTDGVIALWDLHADAPASSSSASEASASVMGREAFRCKGTPLGRVWELAWLPLDAIGGSSSSSAASSSSSGDPFATASEAVGGQPLPQLELQAANYSVRPDEDDPSVRALADPADECDYASESDTSSSSSSNLSMGLGGGLQRHLLVAGSGDHRVALFDLRSRPGRAAHGFRCAGGDVRCVKVRDQTDGCVVAADSNGTVTLFDARAGRIVHERASCDRCVNGMAVAPDGARAFLGADDYNTTVVSLRDENFGQQLHVFKKGHSSHIRATAVSPDGNRVVSSGADGKVSVFDVSDDQVYTVLANFEAPGGPWLNGVTALDDNSGFLVAGEKGHLTAYRWPEQPVMGELPVAFSTNRETGHWVAHSAGGIVVAAGSGGTNNISAAFYRTPHRTFTKSAGKR